MANPLRKLSWLAPDRLRRAVRAVARAIAARLYVATGGRSPAPAPSIVSIPLTASCNKRCNFCEINGVERQLKNEGMTYEVNVLKMEDLACFEPVIRGARTVDFGGLSYLGEPMVSPRFVDAVWYVRRINPSAIIAVTTNATLLTPPVAATLVRHAPVHLTFSIHAATPETYALVMGNGFDRVVKNLEHLAALRRTAAKPVATAINFGVGKHNYKDALAMVDRARAWDIDVLNVYPYYRSPNRYQEDVSLYDNPGLANKVLADVYDLAAALGQRMQPEQPALFRTAGDAEPGEPAAGTCPAPLTNFLLKSAPALPGVVSFAACNRIVLFDIDLVKLPTPADLAWMWTHDILKAMRLSADRAMAICKLCRDPATARLRSVDHDEYKRRRDEAVAQDLARFAHDAVSPSGAIRLLAKNERSL